MILLTTELTKRQIDWAVAKCEGREYDGTWIENFSSNWLLGGPIIEREKMELHPAGNDWSSDINRCYQQYGSTPLIAAMRCYVQSKLGDEVEIPEGLK